MPATENHELLSLLGTMKHDIVEVPEREERGTAT